MPSLTDAHITTLAAIRDLVRRGVTQAWTDLPGYNDEQVARFLEQAVPVVAAGRMKAAALTDAYIAAQLGRAPLGIVPPTIRDGVPVEEVYRRPFVTVWTALSAGSRYDEAVSAGLARATNLAATDVQLTMRATFDQAQQRDRSIRGYTRRADAGACKFCQLVDGAFVKSASAMPLHPGCGCGLEPVLSRLPVTPTPDGVAVHTHGELGPTLGAPEHDFTSAADLQL